MAKDILVIGYPKTGTSWICRLLGDALNSPVGAAYKDAVAACAEGQDRPGDYYIGHGHLMPTNNPEGDVLIPNHLTINLSALKNEKIIVMFRDPRDVIVSANHHWGIGSIHKTIELAGRGEWPLIFGGGLVRFYRAWLKVIPELYLAKFVEMARYEWLRAAPRRELNGILNGLIGVDIGAKIMNVVARQSFATRRAWTEQHGDSLNYGKEWQLRFLRKGIVGDWKNHFDQKAIDMCREYFGELMEEMGYSEPSRNT